MDKRFNFKQVDSKWSKKWIDENLFRAAPSKKTPYVITIPPPNVTGILHMGHALNNTLQDIIVRYKRMKGFEACWMPGTDHAGIATQNVVEKQLAKEGKTRHDIGREELLKRLWAWKEQYGDTIINQLKKIGASCDYERTRFTMDEGYSEAVLKVFVSLYKKGLIYRGERLINWCPRCHTALSDEEAEHRQTKGNLYHFKYPVKKEEGRGTKDERQAANDGEQYVTIATTRPETMLGDTAVAVNPKDDRYKDLIGKTLLLPLVNREIPVIADEFVDPEFGTGCVKVTPAHDPNDFEMGRRHGLEFVNILNEDATINENGGDFEGQDRFEAREAIVESLRELKLLGEIEDHEHAVGHCYRCHTVVEPYMSKQWFVKMEPLAKPALDVVKKGKVKIYPERWEKVYTNWMENIRDWCISRQIWWGHRIPVWYCVGDDHCKIECKEPIVAMEPPEKCPHCDSTNLEQDPDVLDTWFSSWLWPFATFGWPEKNDDLKYFYPGNALFTASEILFFWVARMIMAGIEFMGDIPFKDVYIHGTVRDTQGRKMSKSLGNAIDPLEIVEEYGADALRFSLIHNSGQDLYISKDNFEVGRNFANKVWNAARLVIMNIGDSHLFSKKISGCHQFLPSKWILSRFHSTLKAVEESIENFRYSEAENLIYEFFWNNFCDWYLEIIKEGRGTKDEGQETAGHDVALYILENSLKMMHPFIPFVTEEIWENIPGGEGPLCRQEWPKVTKKLIDKKAEGEMETVIGIVTAVRNIRATWNIKNKDAVTVACEGPDKELDVVRNNAKLIKSRANLEELIPDPQSLIPENCATAVVGKLKLAIDLGGVIDLEKEKARINKQAKAQKKAADALGKRLQNKNFIEKAPAEVVEKEKARLKELLYQLQELENAIGGLE